MHAAAMFGAGVPEGETFLESDESVSAKMEQRAKSGDKTCEGPRLTPWLVSSALYYQRVGITLCNAANRRPLLLLLFLHSFP